jgi:Domain of unknown function (DUF1929)/Bacterial Ig-like domain (group 2)
MLKYLLPLSLVVLVACTDGTTNPPNPGTDNSSKVDSISLFAHRGILNPGESSELQVITKDAAGTILEPTPKLTWALNSMVASIAATRTVLANAVGRTTITAKVNGKISNPITLEVQAMDAANSVGRWSSVIDWPVTVAHASLMPDGTLVTFPWRKTSPWGEPVAGLGYAAGGMTGQPKTMVDTWNPSTDTHSSNWETQTDMFGAGHDLLEDGRLFVSGGSAIGPDWYGIKDNHVLDNGVWSSVSSMSVPRWYPSVTTLGMTTVGGETRTGEVLVSGGVTALDSRGGYITTNVTEVWNAQANTWRTLTGAVGTGVPLYPRMQVAPDGTVFMTGPGTTLSRLNVTGTGSWTNLGKRDNINRVYGSSVLYDEGKVLEVGGSNPQDPDDTLREGSNTAKVIDLRTGQARDTGAMQFGRRNLNATVLPDQTVLVNGGNTIFNGEGRMQKESELWNPGSETFRLLASESIGRPYHSVSLLLPDARVFSAGGYDAAPFPNKDPNYRPSYKNAQIFSPPYLYSPDGKLALRPEILEAPGKLGYDQVFTVRVNKPDEISKACLIRLGSVTHAFNFGQRFVKLEVQNVAGKLEMRSPKNANLAPPGFYFLFVLDQNGVPSIAKTVRLTNAP